MKFKNALLTIAMTSFAQISLATVPTDSLQIARAAFLALVNSRDIPAFYGERSLGTAGKVAFEMSTGVTPGAPVTKTQAARFARTNNPCSKAASYNATTEAYDYDCAYRVSFWANAPGENGKFHIEKLSYKVQVNVEGDYYYAYVTGENAKWSVEMFDTVQP